MNSGNTFTKRHNGGNGGPSEKKKPKMCCQFGEKCYRRNPQHFSEFSHPHLEKLYSLQRDGEDIKLPPDFNSKIDPDTLLSQLQIYRDQGSTVIKEPEKCKQSTEDAVKTQKQVPPKHNQDERPIEAKKLKQSVETKRKVTPGNSQDNRPKEVKKLVQNIGYIYKQEQDIKNIEKEGQDILSSNQGNGSAVASGSSEDSNQTRATQEFAFRLPAASPNNKQKQDIKNIEKQAKNNGSAVASGSSQNSNQTRTTKGFAFRLAAASPYNFFLTAIRDSSPTHREALSIRFHELLDPSLGDLDSSLQINFMIEMDWLMEQYKVYGHEKKPMFILFGVEDDVLHNLKSLPENITAKKIKPSAFGHHHTKMSIFYYKDNSMRVVVSTANLIASDWYNRTQGVWVSPSCPELPLGSDTRAGDSPSEFKTDLLRYVSSYHLPALQEWMSRLRRTDFSAVKVCFVASIPGSHKGVDSDKWGHKRLAQLLKKHCTIPSLLSPAASRESWPVIVQCSSIGTLGAYPDSWMCGELRSSMSQKLLKPGDMPQPPPQFKVIYPSLQNVKSSHDDLLGGACLPYSRKTHEKQMWFRKFLYEWKSDKRHRSQAMPHIKTYTRVSPCGRHLAWFHLTSANLSKAAWGKVQDGKGKSGSSGLYVMSYEAGVLFLPKLLINEEVFSLEEGAAEGNPPFPLPWDFPLSAYGSEDKPWVNEYLY